jgi:hypothetical protein
MVHDRVWEAAGMGPGAIRNPNTNRYLCVGCLEGRLGRALNPWDFTNAPVNRPAPVYTPRLLDRLGFPHPAG